MNEIDAFSLTTVPVEQFANSQPMKSATAFVWKERAQHYLITNWHVITGRDAATGKLETPARPDTDCARAALALVPQLAPAGADYYLLPCGLRRPLILLSLSASTTAGNTDQIRH
jgi:hypothetical protein